MKEWINVIFRLILKIAATSNMLLSAKYLITTKSNDGLYCIGYAILFILIDYIYLEERK